MKEGAGRLRRLLLLAALASLLLVAGAQASEYKSFRLPSPLVDTTTPGGKLAEGRTKPKVNILLPSGYDPHSKRGYPVLWLLHGANGGTDSWLGSSPLGGINTLLPNFPGIIVMPDGALFGMYTNWWNGGQRGGPAWATYHLKLLRRTIAHRYPIRSGRRWHAIGGISMGGQGTLRYAAMLPGYFGSAAGFSAAVPDMQSEIAQVGLNALATAGGVPDATYQSMFGPANAPYAAGNSPQALAPNYGHTRMYLSSGNGVNCPQDPINPQSIALDITIETALHAQQTPFAAAARAAGARVKAVSTCGVHTFGVWDRAIRAARKWGFFKPVASRPRDWTYRTVATSGRMWHLGFHFSKPPTAVAQFTRAGNKLSATGAGKVHVEGHHGCALTAKLPFERTLPQACRR